MIPVEMVDPRAANAMIEYLVREIRRAESERRPLEDRWKLYHRMYKGEPDFEFKEFPFLGASNLVVTVIATDVDTIFSRLMGLLFAPDNVWSTRAMRPDFIEFAARLQEYLQIIQNKEVGAYDAVADFVFDLCLLGTGVLKQRYRRVHKQVYEFRETPDGVYEQIRRVKLEDNPVLEHVSLPHFLLPSTAVDIQTSPWVAEELNLTYGQYMERVRAGVYTGHDRIQSWMATSKGSHVLQNLMKLDRFEPGLGDLLTVKECWLDYDIIGRGEPMSLVATIHIPSMTYLRVDFNPFFSQEKPYSAARFMRVAKRFYGIGLGEMQYHYQHEITAMHNQRIDSGTISNATMFKGKKGIGLVQDEAVFPGRWFLLDNMDDVQTLNMGSGKYDSTAQIEQITLGYSKQRSGVNDYVTGASTPAIGYAAMGTNLQQLEQVTQRFDQTLREVRRALGESGVRITEMLQQFDQGDKPFLYMGEQDGATLKAFLGLPIELARMGVSIDVTATSAALSKESQIRTNTILMQMLQQFYQQNMGALQIALNPQVPEPLKQMAMLSISGSSIMMRRIFDSSGMQDVDQLVPRLEDILSGNASVGAGIGGSFGGAALGGAFGGPQPGMGLLGAGANGNGAGAPAFAGGY